MEKEVLQIQNLTIGYGKKRKQNVIHADLEACLYAGELVCLLGENGTGKSTLIRTLCGFQPALGGSASIFGAALEELSEREIAHKVAVVLTDRVVVPNATVEELVSLGRSPYTGTLGVLNQDDKQRVQDAMSQCGIIHKRESRLSNLSDGEKQKCFIAKALAQDTPIIILDEPTAFLDMPARVEIIQLLRQIVVNSGKSVLLSTHDLDLALQMADRLWLLSRERNLLTGSPEDLLMRNEFQPIFNKRGIEFDNKTGLFRVDYDLNEHLPVVGHGFEYVLLRRALARKGIRTIKKEDKDNNWLEIDRSENLLFRWYKDGECVDAQSSVERIIQTALKQN